MLGTPFWRERLEALADLRRTPIVLRFSGTHRQLPYIRKRVRDPADRLFDLIDRHGLVRARDVKPTGIPTVDLTRLVRAGILDRVARGLYARASRSVGEHVSLTEVATLAPRGVIWGRNAPYRGHQRKHLRPEQDGR